MNYLLRLKLWHNDAERRSFYVWRSSQEQVDRIIQFMKIKYNAVCYSVQTLWENPRDAVEVWKSSIDYIIFQAKNNRFKIKPFYK